MQKRNTAPARVFAAIALVGGFLLVVLVISTSLGGGGSTGSKGHAHAGQAARKGGAGQPVKTPASYVVQSGDTLTAIAHKTGVSVVRIQALNPKVDPQILISGEKLKLR